MDKLKTRAFILKSSNDYQAWRIETYYHLLGQGWYSHVDDSDPRPDGASQPAQQEWDREDAKALAFVNGLMSPTFKLQFKASNSLKDMWNRLESQFQPRGFNQRYSALLKLVQTTLSSCDDNIDQYCSKFTEARDDQILANGEKYTSNNLTEDNLITLFVGGLTQSPTFETFVLHFRQRERMTTLEETMSLAREEARMAARANPHQATVLSTQSKPPNKKRKHRGNCPQHPRMSHDEEDCWTLHPDKRPKKHENPLGWKHGALSALTVDALLTERVSQWAVDTGASLHFCNDLRLFADLASCDPITVRGSTGQYSSSKRGSVYLTLRSRDRKTQPMKLVDVLYVPTLPVNLISASLLKKQGIYFSTLDNTLRLVKNHQEIGSAQDSMGLNMLQLGKHQALDAVACPTVAQVKPDVVLWHQRLSHAGLSQLKMTQNHSTGMEQVSFMESLVCEPCHLAKSQRTVSRKESERSTQPFGRIHLDVVGHLTPELACGDKWVVIITDDLTQYRWSRVTRTKGTAYEVIEWFVNLIKVQHPPLRVLEMVLDRGLEFGGRQLDALARKESIVVRKSSDYTPEQNGTAESSNKVIMVRARSIVLDSGLPGELWPEAIDTAVPVSNRTSTQRDAEPPRARLIQHLTGRHETIDLSHLRRFGCVAYQHIPTERRQKSAKFQARAVKGYFVGYQRGGHTNYRIWIPGSGAIKESPHVTFNETEVYGDVHARGRLTVHGAEELPQRADGDESRGGRHPEPGPETISAVHPHEGNDVPQELLDDNGTVAEDTDDDTIVVAPIRTPDPATRVRSRPGESREGDHRPDQDNSALDRSNPIEIAGNDGRNEATPEITRAQGVPNAERRLTRQSALGHRKTYGQYRTSLGPYAQIAYAMMAIEPPSLSREPKTFREAMDSPESAHWQDSMKREIQQLEDQGAWSMVPQVPPGRQLIPGRWVYKTKLHPDDTVKEYKSRWVVKGYMQQEGVDFFDTFAATLFPSTFRTVFALAASRGWPIYQMDVTGAFLHSLLDSEIYTTPPEGFYPSGSVCKIKKSIYGLKQAPYLWFESLGKALADLGFHSLHSDQCCFTNTSRDVIVMVFVDDIQITGPNTKGIQDLQSGLRAQFKMKDLKLESYLGLQIERDHTSLRLQQGPYARKILERFGFSRAKPVPTPMTDHDLGSHDGELDRELRTLYLQAIGSLLFLANRTRPDMEYAVNFLARFSHNPSIQHWNAVKRVFRYLAGTVDLGIRFQTRAEEPFLFGYSDADFAGDIDERKSTSGYLFIFGGGPISWKSQRQRTVTLSTTEAEYAALTEAVRESNSIRQLLTELGIAVSQPIPILEDNLSTISLANNHANHKRSKHVDIRNHYCREQATTGNIAIRYISTDKQAADSLTKPLGPQKWKAVLEQLRLSGSIATSAGSEGVC